MSKIMTIRVPDDLQKMLSKYANDFGLTRNALVLQILWDWAQAND